MILILKWDFVNLLNCCRSERLILLTISRFGYSFICGCSAVHVYYARLNFDVEHGNGKFVALCNKIKSGKITLRKQNEKIADGYDLIV